MLHNFKPAAGSRGSRKRVGRGNSGKGGTFAGQGCKGQKARSGKGRRNGFEGGQTPLLLRQPKLGGFKSPKKVDFEIINLDTLERKLAAGQYKIEDLRKNKIIRTHKPVKLLSRGAVTKKFILDLNAVSKKAAAALEKAGGKVNLV